MLPSSLEISMVRPLIPGEMHLARMPGEKGVVQLDETRGRGIFGTAAVYDSFLVIKLRIIDINTYSWGQKL